MLFHEDGGESDLRTAGKSGVEAVTPFLGKGRYLQKQCISVRLPKIVLSILVKREKREEAVGYR